MKWLVLCAALAMPGQAVKDLTASWTQDADIDKVIENRQVTVLRLAETRVTDAGLERLRDAEFLREIDLYFAEFFTDDGIAALSGLNRLERLNLRGTRVTSRAFNAIAKMTGLRELDISYTQIDDSGVDLLADLPLLERLSIGGNRIGPAAISSLRLIPTLRHLDLSGMQRVDSGHWGVPLNPQVLAELGGLERLETLRLKGAVINDIGADRPGLKLETRETLERLELLSGMKSLRELDVSRTPIDSNGLKALRALPSLRVLRLSNAGKVDDAAVDVLANWTTLTEVWLDGTAVTPDGLHRLRTARPNLAIRVLP